MLFVPLGYTFGNGMFEMGEVKGGSSYGAGTFAAGGSREPTDLEIQQAFYQGKYLAEIAKKLKGHPPTVWNEPQMSAHIITAEKGETDSKKKLKPITIANKEKDQQ